MRFGFHVRNSNIIGEKEADGIDTEEEAIDLMSSIFEVKPTEIEVWPVYPPWWEEGGDQR